MIAEQTEFQISQYVDGTLPPVDAAEVERLIAADPAARQILSDYQRLNGLLVNDHALPAVQWDRLSRHLSEVVDADQSPSIAGRIGFTTWAGRMRLAAALLIAATAGILVHHGLRTAPLKPTPRSTAGLVNSVVDVSGPVAEAPVGKPQADIAIGPSPVAQAEAGHYAGQFVVPHSSKVVISAAMEPKKPQANH